MVEPTVRSIPPMEEKFTSRTVKMIPAIINPPLMKSNRDVVFDGTFLLIIKAITDSATAPPPNTPPRTSSPNGKKPVPLTPSGEAVEAIRTSAP